MRSLGSFPLTPVWVPNGPRVFNRKAGVAPWPCIYVGRPSMYGNPSRSFEDRKAMAASYERYLFDTGLIDRVRWELPRWNLVCWCVPKLCHAHVLLWHANPEAVPVN